MDTLVNQDSTDMTFALDMKKKTLRTNNVSIQKFIELTKDFVNDDATKGYFETKFSINMYAFYDVGEVEKGYNYKGPFFGDLPWILFKSKKMRQHVMRDFESQTGLKMTITSWINPFLTLFTVGMWLCCIHVKITHNE